MGIGGTDLSKLHKSIWHAIKVISNIYDHEEVIITSTWEGPHCDWSYHYQFKAIDIRYPKLNTKAKIKEIRKMLGKDYDVVEELGHIHIEYDKKV